MGRARRSKKISSSTTGVGGSAAEVIEPPVTVSVSFNNAESEVITTKADSCIPEKEPVESKIFPTQIPEIDTDSLSVIVTEEPTNAPIIIDVDYTWGNYRCWLCNKIIASGLEGKAVGEFPEAETLKADLLETARVHNLPKQSIEKLDLVCNYCHVIATRTVKIICDKTITERVEKEKLSVKNSSRGNSITKQTPKPNEIIKTRGAANSIAKQTPKPNEVTKTRAAANSTFKQTPKPNEVSKTLAAANSTANQTKEKEIVQKNAQKQPLVPPVTKKKSNIKFTGKRKTPSSVQLPRLVLATNEDIKDELESLSSSGSNTDSDSDWSGADVENENSSPSPSNQKRKAVQNLQRENKRRKVGSAKKDENDSDADSLSGVPIQREQIEFSEYLNESAVCLEICVDNIFSVAAAVSGGAHRVELCSALSEGGLTPSVGFLRQVKSLFLIEIFVMIRPRGGDFIYNKHEIDLMKMDISILKENGADGFVFGVLDLHGNINEYACQQLLDAAAPFPCTFHRAFDQTPDPLKALETIVNLGFSRILTSGQEETAFEGKGLIRELVRQSDGFITIIGGGGVTPENVSELILSTGLQEVHASAKKKQQSIMKVGRKVRTGKVDESFIYVADQQTVKKINKNAQDCYVPTAELIGS